jgi:hypothetical protein
MDAELISRQEKAKAARKALLPLVIDVAVPLAAYYLLRHFGVGMVLSLAVSALLPAGHTLYDVVVRRQTNMLAIAVLALTLIGIPLSFLTGSPRFMLAKDAMGTGPLAVWLIVSVLLAKPAMATAMRAFAARTPKGAAAWDHLAAHSPEFRHCLNAVTLVWGVGFLIEFAARLVVVYTLPVDTAVWATNIPLIMTIVGCIAVQGIWGKRIGALIGERISRQSAPPVLVAA